MRFFLCFLSFCLASSEGWAQMNLVVRVQNPIADTHPVVNVPYDNWYYEQNNLEPTPDKNRGYSFTLPVQKAQTIFFNYGGKRLHLYAEPNKSLSLQFDANNITETLRFSGSLGRENEFWQQTGLTFFNPVPKNYNDTLTDPMEILSLLQQHQQTASTKLAKGKRLSADFTRITAADLSYFATSKLWGLLYSTGVITRKNRSAFGPDRWREALSLAYESQPLSNDRALGSYHYQNTVTYFPRYLEQKNASREAFMAMAEAVFGKPFPEIDKEVRQKGRRYFEYKALHYGLEGLSLERALASFFTNGINQGDLEYLEEAYADFLQRFPSSPYRPHVEQVMQPYLASKAPTATGGMTFIVEPGQIKSLEDLLPAHRGRVVYVDLWGTWCGPCRQEFAYSKALKERFQDKAVDFVYIAVEHSDDPVQKWQETATFFGLAGKHILAGAELVKYFRDLYAKEGTLIFPSYLLIDRDGMLVTSHAPWPSSKEKLYQEIEKLL